MKIINFLNEYFSFMSYKFYIITCPVAFIIGSIVGMICACFV